MPEPLLRDPGLLRTLDEEGACCVPVLGAGELAAIREVWGRFGPADRSPTGAPIHQTFQTPDVQVQEGVRTALLEILRGPCERLFSGHRLVAPCFIIKQPGEGSEFHLHQDPSHVDEARHRVLVLWIPIEDVDAHNGALWYLPGSHRCGSLERGLGARLPDFSDVALHASPWLRLCELEAGSGVVFHPRLIHGSPLNRSNRPRVVVDVAVLPERVPMRIYVQKREEDDVRVYEIPDEAPYRYPAAAVLRGEGFVPEDGRLISTHPPQARSVVRWQDLEGIMRGPGGHDVGVD